MSEPDLSTRYRIVYFSDAPYTGGAEKYLFLLASRIDRERFLPIAIINRNPALDPLRRWMEGAGIEVHEVSLRLPYTLRGAGAYVALLRRLRPSLLHLNLPGPFDSQFSLVAPLARMAGVRRIVSTEHLPMVPTFTKAKVLKRFGTRWIDRVITVSENNRTHLNRIHGVPPGKIRVTHIGIPEPDAEGDVELRSELGLSGDAVLLVTVGSLEARKGHDTAFKALAQLPTRVHLAVAGEGELRHMLEETAAALGIVGRVHFLGARRDMPGILRSVDIMVHPSRMDATPYVIVEALAAGLPVIASNVYGIPELIEDGVSGLLVPPDHEAALARAVASLVDDSERRRRIGEAARVRFETRFTIQTHVRKTVAVYDELIDDKDGSG
jgi:glycosyltransferase involved in cell wall biosynthesis